MILSLVIAFALIINPPSVSIRRSVENLKEGDVRSLDCLEQYFVNSRKILRANCTTCREQLLLEEDMIVKIMVKNIVKGVDSMILCLIIKQPVQPDLLIQTLKLEQLCFLPFIYPNGLSDFQVQYYRCRCFCRIWWTSFFSHIMDHAGKMGCLSRLSTIPF